MSKKAKTKKLSETLTKSIEAIPGEDGSQEGFEEVAAELVTLGVPEERVGEILDSLYWAAAGCFGG